MSFSDLPPLRSIPRMRTTAPLVFALNGERKVLAPGEWELGWSLNDYLRAHVSLRGTVRAAWPLAS